MLENSFKKNTRVFQDFEGWLVGVIECEPKKRSSELNNICLVHLERTKQLAYFVILRNSTLKIQKFTETSETVAKVVEKNKLIPTPKVSKFWINKNLNFTGNDCYTAANVMQNVIMKLETDPEIHFHVRSSPHSSKSE